MTILLSCLTLVLQLSTFRLKKHAKNRVGLPLERREEELGGAELVHSDWQTSSRHLLVRPEQKADRRRQPWLFVLCGEAISRVKLLKSIVR